MNKQSQYRYFRSRDEITQTNSNEILTMRTNTNEINIHLLLSNDINRLREAGNEKKANKYF
jgi:hypothetical protein